MIFSPAPGFHLSDSCEANALAASRVELKKSPLRTYQLPLTADARLEDITETEPSVPGGHFFRRGTYYLGESFSSYISSTDIDLSIGGLSQCTGTVIFNLDTGLYLAHHSSTTLAKKENITKLGPGRLRAIVVSAVGLVMDAEYLHRQGIETDFFDILDASSHVQLRYDARLKEVIFSWRDKKARHYLFRWRP